MNESVVAPAAAGVHGHTTTLDAPAPSVMVFLACSTPLTSKAMGRDSASTFPKLKKEVVVNRVVNLRDGDIHLEVFGTTMGSGRKSLTP